MGSATGIPADCHVGHLAHGGGGEVAQQVKRTILIGWLFLQPAQQPVEADTIALADVEQLKDVQPELGAFNLTYPRAAATHDMRGVGLAPSPVLPDTSQFVRHPPVSVRIQRPVHAICLLPLL